MKCCRKDTKEYDFSFPWHQGRVAELSQTNGGFFYVPSLGGERLIIPTKYMEELKNASDQQVDFLGSFIEVPFPEPTTMSGD